MMLTRRINITIAGRYNIGNIIIITAFILNYYYGEK